MKNNVIHIFLSALFLFIATNLKAQIIRTVAGNGDGTNPVVGGQIAVDTGMGQILGVAIDFKGNLYVCDVYYNKIRKITPDGRESVYAGTGYPGATGDGGVATAAQLSAPYAVVCDPSGNLFIADAGNHAVRKVDTFGIMTTVAGILHSSGYYNGDGIPAVDALIGSPGGVTLDRAGNLYIADANSRVRMVDRSGIIHTVAGNGTVGYNGNGGCATCAGIAMDCPIGVAVDDTGNIFIAEANNNVVRKVNTHGIISVFAGKGPSYGGFGGDGGQATNARILTPNAVVFDAFGNLFIADMGNNDVRRVTRAGIISSVVNPTGIVGFSGDGGGPMAVACKTAYISDMCFDHYGNMFLSDRGSGISGIYGHRVREVFTKDTMHITLNHSDTICGAARVAFTVHEQEPHYWSFFKWQINGVTVPGLDSNVYTTDSLRDGDRITCQKIDTASGGILLAISDTIQVIVRPVVVPSLRLATTGDTVCSGQPVTLTAEPTFGGPFPTYQWYVFDTLTDSTGPTFTLTPGLGYIVTAIMTSDAVCAIPDTAHATATMYVNPSVRPLITIVPKEGSRIVPSDTVAYWGQIITLYGETTYGGTRPTYQWFQDGVPVSGSDSNYFFQPYYADHYIYCVLTSNAYCVVPSTDTSNTLHISVDHLITGVNTIANTRNNFNISPNPNNGCFTLNGYLGSTDIATAQITITDVLGKTIYATEANIKNGNIENRLALSNQLTSGVYLLNVKYEGGSCNLKFVIDNN